MSIKPPDDSLSSYFDELLSDDLAASPPQASASQAEASNVLVLPTKTLVKASDGKYASSVVNAHYSIPEPGARAQRQYGSDTPPFADTEPKQAREQKQKLEKLLQSASTHLLTSTAPVAKVVEPQVVADVAVKTEAKTTTGFQVDPHEIQEWDIETPIALAEPDTTEASILVPEPVPQLLEGLEWLENGLPAWAQSRFDVLLLQVSGLTLAVPLVALGQIQPITEELTPLFGQADWFMGFQLTPRGKVSTVNTAKFVMPERYDENFVNTAKYVVSISGVPWGLAVDSVNQPISLYPNDVKWRTNRSKRPWLAGTVKDHMCALLDIPRIGQMLIDADKNPRNR